MAIDRQTLIFFIIMFIFLSLPSGNEQPHSDKEREVLAEFQQSMTNASRIINDLQYYQGYGNVTGFQLSYQDSIQGKSVKEWPLHQFDIEHPFKEDEKYSVLPNEVSENIDKFWGKKPVDDNAYLLNISGRADGEFVMKKQIQPLNLELPQYLKDYYNSKEQVETTSDKIGNITKDGKISLVIKGYQYNFNEPGFDKYAHERINDTIITTLELSLKDKEEVEDHAIELRGVYLQDLGALVATSNSAKFYGSFGLNHLLMNENNFNHVNKLIKQWSNYTNDHDIMLDDMNYSILKSQEQCEFITYFQFDKTKYSYQQLRQIDQELKHPTGAPMPKTIPEIEIKDFLVFSPDCGIVLTKNESKFSGKRTEVLNSQMKNVLTGILILVSMQLMLILRQIKHSRTPGQLSLISSKTLFLLTYEDMLLALMSLLLSTITADLYLILACVATVTFICCGVFEMRFMVSVLTTQANERGTTWWEILRGSQQEEPLLPIANTPEVPNQAWQETSYSNSIFATGFTMSIISVFLIFSSFTWRMHYRKIFEYIGLSLINSFWLPQFFRNTLKNRRQSLSWEFVIGSSVLRVLPIYYFCLYKENPLRHRYDPQLAIVVSTWLMIQIGLLLLQYKMGSRFWINESWLPTAYDYQKLITIKQLQDEHNELSSSILQNLQNFPKDSEFIEYKCNCPICMNDDLTIPIFMKSQRQEDLKKKHIKVNYMITPCNHSFHSECLESWMKYKLQCPVCRTSLPPI